MFRTGNKPPVSKIAKQQSADPGPWANPFDSDSDSEVKTKPARSSSDPSVIKTNPKTRPHKENEEGLNSSSSSTHSGYSAARKQYKDDFRDSGGFENQSVQELQNYAVYKSEETTQTVNNCLKIAEDIREDASKTLVMLHEQGEQITRTHLVAANMDQDLSRGEKLLGSLGGIFSKTWKPKKTRQIKGPVLVKDDSFKRRANHMEQRDKLGLSSNSPKGRTNPRQKYAEPTSALEKVEVEKTKQDDGLNDLSDLLGQLKGMAVDMGSEMDRQNKALDHLQDDVDELNFRVKGANQRGRRLIGK